MLIAIAETGSCSAAARSLKRVQSAVSDSVATLERQLGVLLFDRSDRKPRLTEAGKAILADGKTALRDVDKLKARARSIAEGVNPMHVLVAVGRSRRFRLASSRWGSNLRSTVWPSWLATRRRWAGS